MEDIPFRSSHKYPEQFTLKIDQPLKANITKLKNAGVDTSALCREAIRQAAAKALEHVDDAS